MARKTPAAMGGRGAETLVGPSAPILTLATIRAQHVAARYGLPIETAAIVAALAFGGGVNG